MKKIYEDSKDLHVANTVLYLKSNTEQEKDTYIYKDENFTEKVSKDELIECCKKGVLFHMSGLYDGTDPFEAYYMPLMCRAINGFASVIIEFSDGTTPYYSSEYTG